MDVIAVISACLGVILAIGIFVFLPRFVVGLIPRIGEDHWAYYVLLGVFKLVIFIAYLAIILLLKDIRRLYMYHGAEHKTITCYEQGKELTVENVRGQPRHHPRCGTSFLFVVIAVSIFLSIVIFTPLEIENTFLRMALHLLMLPVIVGVTYEFNRYVGGHDGLLCRALRAPGMWMQNFTTFEPDDSMIEVGIEALKRVLPEKQGADAW